MRKTRHAAVIVIDAFDRPAPSPDLTRREVEVLDLLRENLTNKEIASRLGISERTAKFHVSALLAKRGKNRRSEFLTGEV